MWSSRLGRKVARLWRLVISLSRLSKSAHLFLLIYLFVCLFVVVTCEPPPAVVNGQFQPDKPSYNFNEVLVYTCEAGLILNGSSRIACSANGRFAPGPPTCISKLFISHLFLLWIILWPRLKNVLFHFKCSLLAEVECQEPSVPNAEWVSGARPPYGYQAAVVYGCKPGYAMTKGPTTMTCGLNNRWSSGPTCESKSNENDYLTAAYLCLTWLSILQLFCSNIPH